MLPGISPFIGSTTAEAAALEEEFNDLTQPAYSLQQLGNLVGVDLTSYDLDGPFPTDHRRPWATARSTAGRSSCSTSWRARTRRSASSATGSPARAATGSSPARRSEVADTIQEWAEQGAADGFNVMPPWLPGGIEVFIEEVVPILRARGLFRTEYTGSTLRDHLGLARPASQYAPRSREEDRMSSFEHYRPFGRTGVQVSPLTLGAMMFGAWGNPDHDESIAIIHRALDAGINVIDTADVYARGESEEIVGKALQARAGSRDDVFLATKFHGNMHDEDPNQAGNSRRWIIREVEHSLRRLQVDHIDLYQVHRPRPEVDIDETLGALTDLVRQGKIRYSARRRSCRRRSSRRSGWPRSGGRERPVSEQPPYSILAREVERDILPTAQKYGIGVLPWSPLAGGWLSGRYRRGEEPGVRSSRMERQPARHDPASPENKVKLEAVYALQELADEAGLSLIHLALGFVLAHPAVSSAIIGPRTLEQLESQLGVEKVVLTARRARPDRRDRPAGHHAQRGRPGLRTAGPRRGGAPAPLTRVVQ